MEFGGRVTVEGSKTKVYQVQFINVISIQMTEEKVFWLDVMVDDMLVVQVLENVPLLESESCLNQGYIAMYDLTHEQQPAPQVVGMISPHCTKLCNKAGPN